MDAAILSLAEALAVDPGVSQATRDAANAVLGEASEEANFWEGMAAADQAARNRGR